MPDIQRTDDKGIIMDNFVTYYGQLYCEKPVNMPTLDRMIGNLTLKLDEEDAAALGAPINMNEVETHVCNTSQEQDQTVDNNNNMPTLRVFFPGMC